MFGSMGMDLSDPTWEDLGRRNIVERLGNDLGIFVVDHPNERNALVAAAAGTIAQRLPTPVNPLGVAGYIQWVCTDPRFRGRGLGGQVMTSLLDWYAARGVPNVELHATTMAEAFYRELGFDDSGPRALRRRSA
jgi:GNAT superfamily N-acetyltransferase